MVGAEAGEEHHSGHAVGPEVLGGVEPGHRTHREHGEEPHWAQRAQQVGDVGARKRARGVESLASTIHAAAAAAGDTPDGRKSA